VKINVLGSAYAAKYSAVAMSKNKIMNERGEKGLIIFVSSIAAEEGLVNLFKVLTNKLNNHQLFFF
jgi:NAD(P)-dependent dehydrogenase (short-subunit alcohol dehydrogenase family)